MRSLSAVGQIQTIARRAAALLILALATAPAGASDFGGDYPYPVPLGLQAPDVPADNPVTDE